MLSGHAQGRLLSLLSKLVRPQCILEIGTFTGYSALCLAEGLAPGGELHTIDYDDELAAVATRFFREAGLGDVIHGHWGRPAAEVLPELQPAAGPWDVVFIDADKEQNQTYFNLVIPHVRPGGLVIVDNVLWHGKVLDAYLPDATRAPHRLDKETRAVRAFNAAVAQDPRVEVVFLPLRDGLLLLRKRPPG